MIMMNFMCQLTLALINRDTLSRRTTMTRLCSLLSGFFLFASYLSAQYQSITVDVLPDKKYFTYVGTRSVYQMEPDGSMKELPNLLPENAQIFGVPRHRIRFNKVWYSDGKEIFSMSLNMVKGEKWESLKLPDGISKFSDFEIISEKEAIICGALFQNRILDVHFIFDYTTGRITKTFKSLPPTTLIDEMKLAESLPKTTMDGQQYVRMPEETFYNLLKMTQSYSLIFDPYVLIVEKTGNIITYDTKTREVRKVEVIPPDELPDDPKKLVNSPALIRWVSPLSSGELIMSCRTVAAKADRTNEFVTALVFRTLNPKTGKVMLHGNNYRGLEAKVGPIVEVNGHLQETKNFLENRGFARMVGK